MGSVLICRDAAQKESDAGDNGEPQRRWGSGLIWILALALGLIGVFAVRIVNWPERPRNIVVVAAHRSVSGGSEIIGVPSISPEIELIGVLIALCQSGLPDHPKNVGKFFININKQHLPLSRLQSKLFSFGIPADWRDVGGKTAINLLNIEPVFQYVSRPLSDIRRLEIYPPRVGVGYANCRNSCSPMNPYFSDNEFRAQGRDKRLVGNVSSFSSVFGLFGNGQQGQNNSPCCRPTWPSEKAIPTWSVPFGIGCVLVGMLFVRFSGDCTFTKACGILCALLGGAFVLTGYVDCSDQEKNQPRQVFPHNGEIVPQKYLDIHQLLGYSNSSEADMANVLNTDKQIAVIGALAEGSSIRSIERITGVHRDTIMRLGVKVGQGCAAVMDSKMRDLSCNRLEMDEIWGFVGKKERQVREGDSGVGSVWTFCAIDAETKLVPAFKVGDRSIATATAFVRDVASRMSKRVQISTDGLHAYVGAIESAFGSDVDYAQIVKVYGQVETSNNRRYSAPEFVSSEKKVIVGNPDERLISTSYIERLNATTRLHMRRLTRLTLAFSKKRENFEAAVALHFAYYNFVKRHSTLRCTPAMAAGVERDFWSVGDLLEAAV